LREPIGNKVFESEKFKHKEFPLLTESGEQAQEETYKTHDYTGG
jgi:hypothetical protein